MLRHLEHRRRPVDLRARIDQIGRIELVSAVVALVAACVLETADRAGAFDVPVRQRVTGRCRERPESLALDDEALVVQRPEEILGDAVVVPRRRPREEVVREAEVSEVFADELAEPIGGLTRRLARGVGGDHDRRAVLVRTADHENVVPAKSVIAGERIGRDAEARDMADMSEAARIRPGHCHENLPRCPGPRHGRQ